MQDNDYYNEMDAPFVDLWDTMHPAFGMNSSCKTFYDGKHGCEQPGTNPSYTVGPEMIYEEKIFVDRCLEMVDDHPSPDVPFFLNYCSHIVHSPLQAPANLYHTFDFMENDYDKHRQIYASMVAYLDEGVGKIVDALTNSHMVMTLPHRFAITRPQMSTRWHYSLNESGQIILRQICHRCSGKTRYGFVRVTMEVPPTLVTTTLQTTFR